MKKNLAPRTNKMYSRSGAGWLLVLPYLIHLAIFVVFPVLFSVWLTFHQWNIISPMKWNGLDNYVHLLQDRIFLRSLTNTVFFLVIHIPLQILVALTLAVLLSEQRWMKGFFRSVFFLPVVISGVVITILWQQLLGLETGIFNQILVSVGLPRVEWLSNPDIAMFSVALMATWKNVGLYVILFLTGIQQVPVSLYEAATLEGAGRWQQFRFITLPAIRPTLFMVSVLSTIGGFSLFIEPYVMTDGGPLNSTMSTVLYMYQQAFGYYHMGYAATLGLVFAVLVMVVVGLQKSIFEKDE
jgi:ABC-type sugar transport system permease subunit